MKIANLTRTNCSPAYAVCGLIVVLLSYLIGYGLLVFPSSITDILKSHLHINDVQIGFMSSSFLITYVIMQIPAGIILDIIPIKRVVTIVTLVMAIACFVPNISNNYDLIIVSRLMMGAASGVTFIACLTYSRVYFIATLFPLLTGVSEMMSGLGSLSFNSVFSNLAKHINGQTIVNIIGVFCLLLAALAIFTIKQSGHFSKAKLYPIRTQFLLMLRRKRIILAAFYTGLSFAHFMVLTNVWNITFLGHYYHLKPNQAVWLNSATVIGFVIGCPLCGWLTRWFDKMKLLIVCALAQAILLMLVHHFGLNMSIEAVVLFLLGLATGSVILVFAIVKTYVPKPVYGMTSGIINMFFGGIGVFMTPIVSYVYQTTSSDAAAIFPVVLCSGLSILCIFALYIIDRNIPIRIVNRD